MVKQLSKGALSALLLLLLQLSTVGANELVDYSLADFKQSYREVTALEQRLAASDMDAEQIWKESEQLRQQAKECIRIKEEEISKLSADLNLLGDQSKGEDQTVQLAKRDLSVQLKSNEHLLTSCRLLLVKSEALLRQLKALQKQNQASALESQHKTLFTRLTLQAMDELQAYLLAQPLRLQGMGVTQLSVTMLLAAAVVGVLLLWFALRIQKRVLNGFAPPGEEGDHRPRQLMLTALSHHLPALLPLLFLALFWVAVYQVQQLWFFEATVVVLLLAYVLIRGIVKATLIPVTQGDYYLPFPQQSARSLGRAIMWVVTIGVIWGGLINLPYQQPVPDLLIILIRLGMISTLVFGLMWLLATLFSIQQRGGSTLLRLTGMLALLGIILLELIGYRNLADYLLLGMVGTIFVTSVGWLISFLLLSLINGIEVGRYQWQKRLQLGAEEVVPGLFWLRLFIIILVVIAVVTALLQVWQVSIAQQSALVGYFFEGFSVGATTLVPARIFMAIAVFAVMLSAIAWLKRKMESNWLRRSRMEAGARNSIVAISGYLAGAIAIIVAMSMAGVDFGNLAIIAGALSVGIGFGLQNIINNFVSGLILLFERPIRRGDWIVVNGTEGVVENINIRSTLIRTFDRADVIVPNSELISGQVVNWMLKDRRGRVKVPVGVAYGTDLQLVKEILLDIANQRSEVVLDGSVTLPKVVFLSFGDSALLLELRFYIADVDKRVDVMSEVNFEIDRLFAQHQIEIPFPQRDLHLRSVAEGVVLKTG
jgi:potassium efflux system protein